MAVVKPFVVRILIYRLRISHQYQTLVVGDMCFATKASLSGVRDVLCPGSDWCVLVDVRFLGRGFRNSIERGRNGGIDMALIGAVFGDMNLG